MVSILNSSYYRNTRWPLIAIGQWPFQSARRNRFFKSVTTFLIASLLMPMIIKSMKSYNDVNLVMECIPLLCVSVMGFVKLFSWGMNSDNMRELLLCIETDWNNLKVENDIKLLTEFTEHGKMINNLYIMSISGFMSLYFAAPFIPILMDIWIPLNESRPRIFLYQAEYFVDQNEYYFFILIHAYLTLPLLCGAIVLFDNLFSVFINHLSGMCSILKLHLECVHKEDISDYGKNALERIKICADMQTNILEFVQHLESICTIPFLILVGLNTMIITMTGTMVVLKHTETSEILKFASLNIGTIFHLFLSSWQGHTLIVESESVFLSVYQSEWYTLPIELQRMLIPMMMRSVIPCQITAGKIYVMSMASFGATMRMNMSFFTLLLSLQ